MKKTIALLSIMLFAIGNALVAQETAVAEKAVPEPVMVPTTAVLHFESRSRRAEGDKIGKSIADLLFVNLLEGGTALERNQQIGRRQHRSRRTRRTGQGIGRTPSVRRRHDHP